ncbi:MAG: hypothetical protein M3Z15_00220 [Pseudomonadota bacterium]|nr:hypothetical protein [Pseudomonadota bacterium]
MKKDLNLPPLLPFTTEEELALSDKIDAMAPATLAHYVESAQLALRNTALDPSWRPRVEIGLKYAEAAAQREALAPTIVAEPPPTPAAAVKTKKVAAA